MSKSLGLPLGNLPHLFKKCGYHESEAATLVSMLMHMCQHNEEQFLPCVVSEFIKTEMDLDDLHAQIFILEGLSDLLQVGMEFRKVAHSGHLQRYSVHEHIIILEVDDDY